MIFPASREVHSSNARYGEHGEKILCDLCGSNLIGIKQ